MLHLRVHFECQFFKLCISSGLLLHVTSKYTLCNILAAAFAIGILLLVRETLDVHRRSDVANVSEHYNGCRYVFIKHALLRVADATFYPEAGRNFDAVRVEQSLHCYVLHFFKKTNTIPILNLIAFLAQSLLLSKSEFQILPVLQIAIYKRRKCLK